MRFLIKLLSTLCTLSFAPLNEEDQKWLDQLTQTTKDRIEASINEPYQLLCKELSEFKDRLEDENSRDKLKELVVLFEVKFDEYSNYPKETKALLDEFRSIADEKSGSEINFEPGYTSLFRCEVTDSCVKIHEFWIEKMRSYHLKNREWLRLKEECERKRQNIVLTRF